MLDRPADTTEFIRLVRSEGKRLYRELPWRDTFDPYLVLCSEVMLQQTQVSRVLIYWPRWILAFPTVDALAAASVADVLELWQGLGYNRRALALKKSAEICSDQYSGKIPEDYEQLLTLPGVGPVTAAGVCVFAFNRLQVYLETNVRTVFIHHFFAGQDEIRDKEIIPLVEASCDRSDPRSWYYALLDYGNYLKRVLPNPSRRSKHHSRQSAFDGSVRQKRAFLLREVLAKPQITSDTMLESLNLHELQAGRAVVSRRDVEEILAALSAEGFLIAGDQDRWIIGDQAAQA